MSTSLLLALLETHKGDEGPDRSADYRAWIGSEWNGQEYTGGVGERRELMMRELYDVLQEAIIRAISGPASVPLGTVLARTLTDETTGLREAAARLRAILRPELVRRLDRLIRDYEPINRLRG
jgi:hypothetical protein